MEMWISHNRSKVDYSTVMYTLGIEFCTNFAFAFNIGLKKKLQDLIILYTLGTSTYAPVAKKMAKCLISYYGITNETCWYPSKIESAEADVQDTLGNKILDQYFVLHCSFLYLFLILNSPYRTVVRFSNPGLQIAINVCLPFFFSLSCSKFWLY